MNPLGVWVGDKLCFGTRRRGERIRGSLATQAPAGLSGALSCEHHHCGPVKLATSVLPSHSEARSLWVAPGAVSRINIKLQWVDTSSTRLELLALSRGRCCKAMTCLREPVPSQQSKFHQWWDASSSVPSFSPMGPSQCPMLPLCL